jgi:hypothetical protein
MPGCENKRTGGALRFAWCVAALALAGGPGGCAKDPPPAERTGNVTGNGAGAGPGGSAGASAGGSGSGAAGSSSGAAGTSSGGSGSGASGSGSGTAGSSGGQAGSAAAGSGGGEMVDCSALPLPMNTDDIVSTFEDGTGSVAQVAGRGGGFYMFNDGSGTQTPPPGGLPDATEMSRCGGMYALCMSGHDFTVWGAGMGTDLGPVTMDGDMMVKSSWDASAYSGISFWAKANAGSAVALRVSLKDANTAPEGGVCDPMVDSGAEACNDDWGRNLNLTEQWAPYTIMYSDMAQSNWGKQFPAFDAEHVFSIQFQVNKGLDFDLCIDDLAFVR